MSDSRPKSVLLFVLALTLGIQITVLMVYYLASPYLTTLTSPTPGRPRQGSLAARSQTDLMLTSCSADALPLAVSKVRTAVVYITGHPATSLSPSAVLRPSTATAGLLTSDKMGSGIIVDPRGYILTNHHVVGAMTAIRVSLFGQRETHPAEVVVKDPEADLAVIKIAAPYPLTAATLGNSDMLKLGDEVLAIGCPFNLEQSVSHGIVSDVKRTVTIDGRSYVDLIQTDAAINSGNSGGALINLNGEVLGINVAIYAPNRVYCGVGFAIPINRAKLLLMKGTYAAERSTTS